MKHILVILLLLTGSALGQQGNTVTLQFPGAPTGTCSNIMVAVNTATGDYYSCLSGAWNLIAGGAGGGASTKSLRSCTVDGMKADGVTNDSTAFTNCLRNAYANNQAAVLPCGQILVNTSVNGTNIPNVDILGGCGAQISTYSTALTNQTTIMCNTGSTNPCLDLTGSGWMRLWNFSMRAASTYSTPSAVLILMGRDNAAGGGNGLYCFPENIEMDHLFLYADNDATNTLNAGRGRIGILNVGVEQSGISNFYIRADTGVEFEATNDLSNASAYQTLQTGCGASMTEFKLTNGAFSQNATSGANGSLVEMRGANGITFDTVTFSGNLSASAGNVINFGSTSTVTNIKFINTVIESFPTGVLPVDVSPTALSSSDFDFYFAGMGSTPIFNYGATGQTISSSRIRVNVVNGTAMQLSQNIAETWKNDDIVFQGVANPIVGSNIVISNGSVRAIGFTDAQTNNFGAGSAYRLHDDTGVSDFGPLTIQTLTQNGLTTTYNTLATTGNGLASVQAAPTAVTIGSGANIASTSLCSTTLCPAGDYDIGVYIEVTTACTTTGTYIPWLGWTDDQGAKTGSSTTTYFVGGGLGVTPATASAGATLGLASLSNYLSGHLRIHTTGAATNAQGSINYGATATACGTGGPMIGKMYLTVTRLR